MTNDHRRTTGTLLDQALARPLPTGHQPLVGLILAAGRGSRFDETGETNKLLALIDGVPVACHSASALAERCEHRVAVVRPGATALAQWLEQLGCIVVECPDAHSGMGHSLAWGVAQAVKLFDPKALLVALGDMPYVSTSTVARLADIAGSPRALAAPVFEGKRGHPVLFGSHWFETLGRCSGDRGAETVLRNNPSLTLLDVQDPGVLRDIDLPSDLEASPLPGSRQ